MKHENKIVARHGWLVIARHRTDGGYDVVASFNLSESGAGTSARLTFDRYRWSEGDEFVVFNLTAVPTMIEHKDACALFIYRREDQDVWVEQDLVALMPRVAA